ncbi:Multidrug export protein MepA [bioreactor metagenome]|uniref:Multidrug export protein MepA n=1 Tax=bioreactor metagenome TaxID=1076179 RepID=A0A645B4H5_9ZZZZ|nr:MATE family efflux transporter [Candidatus Metalachnospira sp.]
MEETVLKNENIMEYEPIGKLLRKFAIPSIIAMLVNSIYNIVDQIFIGQGVGYLGNAATTVALPILNITLAVAMLIGVGGNAFAAIKLGEKNKDTAERTLGTVFFTSVVVGILMVVLTLFFLSPLLNLFGATENNFAYAYDYASITIIGTPFILIGISLSNFARTDGSPRISMMTMLVGAIMNTILDPIFIFVFKWGVKGAAIATIMGQIVSAILLTLYFVKKGNIRLKREYIRFNLPLIKQSVALGTSSCITQASAVVLQIILNNSLVKYGNMSEVGGDVALSAMGVVLKVSMILLAVNIGIATGAQPILGYNRGAGNYTRIRKTYLLAIAVATVISLAGWFACISFPETIISIFGNDNAQFTKFGTRCLRIYMFGIFTSGFQMITTTYFQATGQAAKASILSMLRQLILLIPLIVILPLFMGLDGIIFSGPIADFTSTIIILIFAGFEMVKLNKHVQEEKA